MIRGHLVHVQVRGRVPHALSKMHRHRSPMGLCSAHLNGSHVGDFCTALEPAKATSGASYLEALDVLTAQPTLVFPVTA